MLRVISSIAVLLLISLALILMWHFWPRKIDVVAYPIPQYETSGVNMDVQKMGAVRLGYFSTGHNISPEAFIYSGGSLTENHTSVYSGMVVQHPKGTFMFEGGIGGDVAAKMLRNFNNFQRNIFAYTAEGTAREQLEASSLSAADIDFILLTHLHWDHTGVIEGFPDKEIWTTEEEFNWGREHGSGADGFFPEDYMKEGLSWKFVTFDSVKYESFDRSLDLYGDGSIVLVPLPGHTAGSVGMFVTLKNGSRYLFIGDISWSQKALDIPAKRPPLGQHLADKFDEELTASLVQLHHLKKKYPKLQIIPTHDEAAFKDIERLSSW